MGERKQSHFQPDPRTWLLLCLLGIVSILLIHSEIGGLFLFLGCLLIHLVAGKAKKTHTPTKKNPNPPITIKAISQPLPTPMRWK